MTQREHQKEQTQGQETGFTGWDTNTGGVKSVIDERE